MNTVLLYYCLRKPHDLQHCAVRVSFIVLFSTDPLFRRSTIPKVRLDIGLRLVGLGLRSVGLGLVIGLGIRLVGLWLLGLWLVRLGLGLARLALVHLRNSRRQSSVHFFGSKLGISPPSLSIATFIQWIEL